MYNYRVTGTLIFPGPFVAEGRIWVDRIVGPIEKAEHAAVMVYDSVCLAEELDPDNTVWGADLHVRMIQRAY